MITPPDRFTWKADDVTPDDVTLGPGAVDRFTWQPDDVTVTPAPGRAGTAGNVNTDANFTGRKRIPNTDGTYAIQTFVDGVVVEIAEYAAATDKLLRRVYTDTSGTTPSDTP